MHAVGGCAPFGPAAIFHAALMTSYRPTLYFAAVALGLLASSPARAQSEEAEPPPALGKFESEELAPTAEAFVVPEVPVSFLDRLRTREKSYTLKVGLAALFDYTGLSQDANSLAQVGAQDSQWQVRDLRLMFHGTIGSDYKVGYLVALAYKGFDMEPETTWDVVDLSFSFPLGSPATKLTVGKTKETFAYEMAGDAASLPSQERVLSPFFLSRNIGAKLTQVVGADQRMTVAAGIFNDWFINGDSLAHSGTDVTARVTGLVWDRDGGRSFLHLGAAVRYYGADNDALRFKGRPESNVTDNYVDTGTVAGDHSWNTGLEVLWNEGPYSVLAEYNHASVDSTVSGDPSFSGYYLTGSWVLTGESRPYDRTVGFTRRIMPKGKWGAFELVTRFSHVDLSDGLVQGGSFDKTSLGLNWWATRRWKFGFSWGRTWLDRSGKTGVTDAYLSRFQWIY